MGNPNQPIFILKEGTERIKGRPAMTANINAAKATAEAVRTTLGPLGMDKMLVQGGTGETTITNDGATILREIDIEHPAARLIIEVSKNQEESVFDGTTSAVVLTGSLLEKSEDLLTQQIHPTVICRGYRKAEKLVQEELENLGWMCSTEDLKRVAGTALTGKSAESASDTLSDICVQAILAAKDSDDTISLENIKVLSFEGGTSNESGLELGVVVEKEKLHSEMESSIVDASILLMNTALDIKETKFDAQLTISDPNQINDFLAQEENALKEMAASIGLHGINVVFCQKEIDDLCIHYLAKLGITAFKRIKQSDMDSLARLTGAKFVSKVDEINQEELGRGDISAVEYGEHHCTLVKSSNATSVTVCLRGATSHSSMEVERAFDDALGVTSIAYSNKVIAGGGAIHAHLARHLRNEALHDGSRVGMAIEAFASALESIPRTLAENAGLDPVDTLIALRKAEGTTHGVGIDGEIINMVDEGVIEPRKVVSNAIGCATESAIMILRIDDVISMKTGKGGGMGMPDMSGMMG